MWRNSGAVLATMTAVVVVLGLGCNKIGSMGSSSDAGANVGVTTPGSAAAAPAAPCIAGKWDAKDLSSKIKSSIKSAANAGLTPTGGKIFYDFAAPASGKGVVTVTVENFVTKMAMAQSGVQINGTITLSGPAKMPYTVGPADDTLTMAAPTEGKINAHADVRTTGLANTQKTEDSTVDLTGTFIYECAGDKLQMWNKSSGKQGTPLSFTRVK